MSTGAAEFARQLRDLGHDQVAADGDRVTLPYEVPIGRHAERIIRLGFAVPADFPLTPPGGPHVSPRLGHAAGAVHASPAFGSDWEYWSRPFQGWPSTDRTVRTYMAHVRRVLQLA
jgi:hypothetical protein